MRYSGLIVLLWCMLLLPLTGAEMGTWQVEAGKSSFTVSLTIRAPFRGMADFTGVQTTSPLKNGAAPKAEDGYFAPGIHKWTFSGEPGTFPLRVTATAQYCSPDGTCFLPEEYELGVFETVADWRNGIFSATEKVPAPAMDVPDRIPVLIPEYLITGRVAGYQNPGEMVAFLKGEMEKSFFDLSGKGVWLTMLLVLLGGLALNLTPCVLPLIPVNLAIIGAGECPDRTLTDKAFRGVIYGLGITIAYGLLGVIAVLTGATFGVWAGSWLFNGAIALLFLFLGLSMFGIFNFDLSRYGASIHLSGAKLAGIFLLGAVSATLAGACVAPVLAAVLIRAAALYANGNNAGLFLPFLLGLGMALPWPFAMAGIALFPKPGAWMVRVKQALGIFILVLAVYYGYLAVSLAAYRMPVGETDEPAAVQIGAALELAKKENKRVLLDFWATWCKNCTAMEHHTFTDPDVREALKDYVLVRVQAEDPADPATKVLLDTYEVTGLPTLVILTPE